MAKQISFLFLALFGINCIGQNDRKVTVTYTLYLADDTDTNSDLRNAISLESGKLTFKLYIKDSISYYIENNGLKSSELSSRLATVKTQYTTPIYYDNKNAFLYNNDPNFIFFEKNEYLISKSSIKSWLIGEESKLIDGNLCYKATATDYYYHRSDNKRSFEITAWFCPKLPFKFGPVFYNELPGLILEINYLNLKLVATKIEYGVDEKNIRKPIGTKNVSFDDYPLLFSNKLTDVKSEIEKLKN